MLGGGGGGLSDNSSSEHLMLIYFSSRSADFSTGCEIGTIVLTVKYIRALDRGRPDVASVILEMPISHIFVV